MKFSRWAVPASLVGLMIFLGGCSSKAPAYNQTPAITGIIPSNATVGSDDFTVFISGTGFISSASKGVSFGYWNGSPRSTSYNVQTGQLQMTVLASDVDTPGQAQITVVNPPPGGGQSLGAATFYIEPTQANGPTISSLSPSSVPVQTNSTPPPVITITGSNFVVGDVVTWNGQYRNATVTYNANTDSNDVTFQPNAADLSTAGVASISVAPSNNLASASPSVNLTITGKNAASPTLTSLTPSSATAGAPDLEVLVKGTGFVFNSTVQWNSMPVATAYLSSTQLMAMIPAADLATQGTNDVSVTTPAPGGGISGTQSFNVNNPAPTLSSITPTSAVAGGASFTLTLTGTNFTPYSTVGFGSAVLPPALQTATQLQVTVPAADIATAGSVNVTVTNPAPGGGTSSPQTFTINAP